MVDNITPEDKNVMNTKKYKVEFNFEFLDDYRDESFGERLQRRFSRGPFGKRFNVKLHDEASDAASTVDDASSVNKVEKNKGFIANWGPETFSPKFHPLALMVSWFE